MLTTKTKVLNGLLVVMFIVLFKRYSKTKLEDSSWKQHLSATFERHRLAAKQWRNMFPVIDQLLEQIDSGKIAWPVELSETTDPSKFVVTVAKSRVSVGELVSGSIQARDYKGKLKPYGGDYLKASLRRIDSAGRRSTEDGIACELIDHGNGTYTWRSVSAWPGKSLLEIEMVHSSEAVVELVRQTSATAPKNLVAIGTFPTGTKTKCHVSLNSGNGSKRCDFSKPLFGSNWFCEKPSNDTCPEDLVWLERNRSMRLYYRRKELFRVGKTFHVFSNSNMTLSSGGTGVLSNAHLSPCSTSAAQTAVPSGFYFEGKWVSLLCKNRFTDLSTAYQCFRNKTVYFVGDSTMRQWYYLLVKKLALNDTGENNKVAWSMPRKGRNEQFNISMFYKSHGYPLHNKGPPKSRPYIVATLRDIPNGERAFVVLNIGAHFVLYSPLIFMQRMHAIRKEVVTLLNRNPLLTMFIRSGVRVTDFRNELLPSEWYIYRTDQIMKRELLTIPGVILLDTWDMTSVHAQPNIHADENTIGDFISLFMSYIC